MTGNPYIVSVRTPEILDKLEKHPIWRQRAQEKAARAGRHRWSAPASPASPRTTAPARDCSLGRVEIGADGRISIHCDHVEMGNGIGTALANRVAAHLGGVADEVTVARVDSYDALGLVTSGDPYTMDQKTQDAAEKNPRWVPAISSATSASIGAHVGTHAAAEAARVIFRFGLWPAALELWRIAPTDPRAKEWAKAQLAGRPAHHAGPRAAGACRRSPRPRMRATSSPARWRTASPAGPGRARASRWPASNGPRRDRCAGGAQGRRQIPAHRSRQRQVSADRQQPDRHRLHLDVRHARPRRDRARDRRAAHRQGLQRARMRPGAGAGGRARPGAGRLRDGRRLRAARDRCRPTRAAPATANGISGSTWSRAARTCRCAISRSRCCRR